MLIISYENQNHKTITGHHSRLFFMARTMMATKASRMRASSPTIHLSHSNALAKYVIFFCAFFRADSVP